MENTVCARFAPSPSGRLHLGNMLSSLLAWLDARSLGGRIIFRLEDLDPERSFSEYAALAAEDFRWLGLDWDGGWPGDESCSQGNRTRLYEEAFQKLEELGLIYPCYCSRAQRLAASAPHPGENRDDGGCACRGMSLSERAKLEAAGRRPAYKVIVPDKTVTVDDRHYGEYSQNLMSGAGDFIVRRSDGVFAYQLAVSVDDSEMGINRVVRARDLLSSAPRQKWLIELLGGKAPAYCHCPLLVSPEGRKMSKREGDLNMEVLRRRFTPRELCGRLALLCGLTDSLTEMSPYELLPLFDWDKIPKEDIMLPPGF